jgi:thiol-disulfide isomerase/thioredoxin
MMVMKILKTSFLSALFAMVSPILAFANEPITDPEFDALSKSIPGFQRILNTPPVPETKFLNSERQAISLQEFSGKAWCTPCVREMPDLNQLSQDFGGEHFEVVAIASGQQVGMNPDAFLKEKGLESLALYEDPHASLMKLFDTQTLPTTLIVDKQGRIRGGVRGAIDWNSDAARATITYLMEN